MTDQEIFDLLMQEIPNKGLKLNIVQRLNAYQAHKDKLHTASCANTTHPMLSIRLRQMTQWTYRRISETEQQIADIKAIMQTTVI